MSSRALGPQFGAFSNPMDRADHLVLHHGYGSDDVSDVHPDELVKMHARDHLSEQTHAEEVAFARRHPHLVDAPTSASPPDHQHGGF